MFKYPLLLLTANPHTVSRRVVNDNMVYFDKLKFPSCKKHLSLEKIYFNAKFEPKGY